VTPHIREGYTMKKLSLALIVVLIAIVIGYLVAVLWMRESDSDLAFDLDSLRSDSLRFGTDFLWGASTSAYQVEGNSTNCNWSRFETTTNSQGVPPIRHGDRCGLAADHWNRYKQDIQLLKEMHLNAFRFSVEWSKVEPEEGVFVDSVLDHYERVVDELLANGIEPLVTLHHFTNPLWFEEKGGLERDDAPDILARYATRVARRLGSKVRLWSTINEPNIYAIEGYYRGSFPPGVREPGRAVMVFRNLLRAHTACYQAIKKIRPDAQVGLLASIFVFDPPQPWNLLDVMLAHYLNKAFSVSMVDYLTTGIFDFSLPGVASGNYDAGVAGAFDFVGLNYYSRLFYHVEPFTEEKMVEVHHVLREELTDKGWEIYPEGLYRALHMISSRTEKPIYITENGIADDSDLRRARFIEDHLRVANRAIRDGVNLKGYFYWSLIDNFELTDGFDVRFGLYAVDYKTQLRTLRKGSLKYREIIEQWERGIGGGAK
jgi:beta-glucosidase